ncbi:MAG: helix-turn-helix transcriptional regulator [Candidatus Acidiferrales bacterium]
MIVGSLLRQLREARHMSQGEIEKRAGLLRCYISRLENRHTVPLIETLEKMTRALAVPLYKLFYDGNTALKVPNLSKKGIASESAWGSAVADEIPFAGFSSVRVG